MTRSKPTNGHARLESRNPQFAATVRNKLLRWFDAHKRDLPWRADRDPYRIWVSEVMLQQTTVAAVVPYFERFIAAFPTIRALAEADEQCVLRHWEGLGYYRRARHLHAAAKQLVADHAGELPDNAEVLAPLPGIGRYILGAVLSQAFDRRLPIVEANSLRVLARVFGFRDDPRRGAGKAWVWSTAEAILPRKRVGDFNQGLMELGALVCKPTAPECDRCPLAKQCVAKRDNLQSAIPPSKKPPKVTFVRELGIIIRKRKGFLICQRPSNAKWWQNMWEVPHGELKPGEDLVAAAKRIAKELTALKVRPKSELLTVKHSVTRFAITMECVEADLRGGSFASDFYASARWVTPTEVGAYPVSSPQRALMTELAKIAGYFECSRQNLRSFTSSLHPTADPCRD